VPNGNTFDSVAVLTAQVRALLSSLEAATQVPNPIMGYVVNSKRVEVSGATLSILNSSNAAVAAATTDITGFHFFADTGILIADSNYTAKVTPIPKPYKTSTHEPQTFTWSGTAIPLANFVMK
jgi:hypothetical protein